MSVLLGLGAALLALAAGWAVSRRLWPFGRCWRCKGTGRGWGSNSRRWNLCRRCGGSGRRNR